MHTVQKKKWSTLNNSSINITEQSKDYEGKAGEKFKLQRQISEGWWKIMLILRIYDISCSLSDDRII